ncbi:MAG: glycerophosphodiester phosphodiesterase [Formosimonas sp.]
MTFAWQTLNGQAPIIIAHRGASGYLPDHTLEGYTLAIEMGADFIEPDLVATQDGVLIARHEPNLIETTDIAQRPEFAAYKRTAIIDGVPCEGWFACDLTYAQIQTLRAIQPRPDRDAQFNGRFKIPTFAEILTLREQLSARLGREIGVYPETKHPTWHAAQGLPLEQTLIDLLQQFGLNHAESPVYIQSFELGNLRLLQRISAVKRIYLLDGHEVLPDGTVTSGQPYDFAVTGDARTYGDMLTDDGLRAIAQVAHGIGPWKVYISSYQTDAQGMQTRLPATDLVARAHRVGLAVHPYTFRNETKHLTSSENGEPQREYAVFFALGVDGLFSDFTDTAIAARHDYFYPKTAQNSAS